MRKFWITFNFYAKEHFTKKSLIWLVIFIAAPIAIFFAIDYFGGGSYDSVAIVQESSEFILPAGLFEDVEQINFHFVDQDVASELLSDGVVDDVFIIAGDQRPELRIESNRLNPAWQVEMRINQFLTNIHLESLMLAYDLPADVIAEIITPIEIEMEVADFEDLVAVEIINFILPYAVFMLVLMSGSMTANSVASEKTSRVMEVMLGKVHPTYTMISKVLASLVGVLMPIIGLVVGAVIAHIIGFADLGMIVELIDAHFSFNALLLTFAVLILGYFCFIFLFAAVGAVANSIESLQSALQPLMYVIMGPFFLTIFLAMDSVAMNILVYVPIISPFVLVQRYLIGASGTIEVFIVLILMIAFSIFTLWLSARLYMNGIANTKEKLKLKDWKNMLVK